MVQCVCTWARTKLYCLGCTAPSSSKNSDVEKRSLRSTCLFSYYQPMSQQSPPPPENYERLGREYYDIERHPTCADFRYASKRLLAPLIAANEAASDLD